MQCVGARNCNVRFELQVARPAAAALRNPAACRPLPSETGLLTTTCLCSPFTQTTQQQLSSACCSDDQVDVAAMRYASGHLDRPRIAVHPSALDSRVGWSQEQTGMGTILRSIITLKPPSGSFRCACRRVYYSWNAVSVHFSVLLCSLLLLGCSHTLLRPIFTNREARAKQEVGGTAQKKTKLSNARPKGGGAVRMRQSQIQPALNNSIRLYSPLSNLEIQRSRSACNCRLSACAKKVLHLGSKFNHFGFRGFNRIALACNACWCLSASVVATVGVTRHTGFGPSNPSNHIHSPL